MTDKQIIEMILNTGFKEYKNPYEPKETRTFASIDKIDGPDCDCNDRPPEIHLKYHNLGGQDYKSIELEVVGESSNNWIRMMIYSITPEEFKEKFPKIIKALSAMWIAGYKAIK